MNLLLTIVMVVMMLLTINIVVKLRHVLHADPCQASGQSTHYEYGFIRQHNENTDTDWG